jgi:arylsulfatase A-like enzyme
LDLARYYDEIARLDFHIGQVQAELERQGVLDNTIIVIMADNGRPFPRDKTRVYESGIKTPLIIKGPGKNRRAGEVCNSLLSVIDLAPTLLALAHISPATTMQGKSFVSLLENPEEPFRDFVFAEHNWHDYEAHERMVRSKDFLYVLNSRPQFPNQGPADAVTSTSFGELKMLRDSGKLTSAQADIFRAPRPMEELYACDQDTLQLHNLADLFQYQETLNMMRKAMNSWQTATMDNVPAHLTPDWYDRETGKRIDSSFSKRGKMPGL